MSERQMKLQNLGGENNLKGKQYKLVLYPYDNIYLQFKFLFSISCRYVLRQDLSL